MRKGKCNCLEQETTRDREDSYHSEFQTLHFILDCETRDSDVLDVADDVSLEFQFVVFISL